MLLKKYGLNLVLRIEVMLFCLYLILPPQFLEDQFSNTYSQLTVEIK